MRKIKNDNYILICFIAYIVGLFFSGLFDFSQGILFLLAVSILTIIGFLFTLWQKSWGINYIHCVLLALIVISGFYYYQWRLPTINNSDVSNLLAENEFLGEIITLQGKLLTNPQVNQKQKGQFIFQAKQLINYDNTVTRVTGKVYVTSPLLQVTGLYPSMTIRVRGNLYQPQNSLSLAGFNFADYLKRDGIFSGLSAKSLDVITEGNFWNRNLTFIRRRIVQTHVRYLKVPWGNLVSSMVIGHREVDLGRQFQNSFRFAGLAHIQSASGFHVSIVLGLLLYLTRRFASSRRLLIVTVVLVIYAAIAGFYPSILRACLMGFAVMIGMVYDRSVKVNGSLLLAAVILLLINPLWIWDLGFQLSFLATWGLVVCLPTIVDRLDWLPPTIANVIAVPLSATIWTLPLVCYVFHYFPVYGIITNVIATPLVLIIIIGGFISAFLGLFIPLLGSSIAYILFPFVMALIEVVDFSNKLPFSTLAVGEISIVQLLFIYLIFGILCLSKYLQKYWLVIIVATLISVVLPLMYQKINLVQVSILNDSFIPTIVVQNQNNNTVINLGDKENMTYNVIPFLRSEAINQLNVVLNDSNDRKELILNQFKQIMEVKNIDDSHNITTNNLSYLTKEKNNLLLDINEQKWLIVNKSDDSFLSRKMKIDKLILLDRKLSYEQIKQLKAKTIITTFKIKNKAFLEYLYSNDIRLISIENKQAIQWQPKTGFKIYGNVDS